jgi:hypothetical protein
MFNRVLKYAIAGFAALLPAFGQVSLVSADAYVQGGANSVQNFGSLANLVVGPGGASATPAKALVQFEVSGFNGVLSTDVKKAVVWVWVNRVIAGGAIEVSDVTASWAEGTVTWNTAPVPGAVLGTIAVSSAGQWVGLDITPEFQMWIATPSQNHGLQFSAFTQPATAVQLDSKENTSTSHPPFLQVILNGPAEPTGPQGPAGANGGPGRTDWTRRSCRGERCDRPDWTSRPHRPDGSYRSDGP